MTGRYSYSLLAHEEQDVNQLTNPRHCKHLVKSCHRCTCSSSRCCGDAANCFLAPTVNTPPGVRAATWKDATTFCVASLYLTLRGLIPGHGEFLMNEQLVYIAAVGSGVGSSRSPGRQIGPPSRLLREESSLSS